MFEFKAYLSEKGAANSYVQDLIYFSGLRESDLPARPHNCFGCDLSFERILNILGQISGPTRYNRQGQLNFGSDDEFANLVDPTLAPFQFVPLVAMTSMQFSSPRRHLRTLGLCEAYVYPRQIRYIYFLDNLTSRLTLVA